MTAMTPRFGAARSLWRLEPHEEELVLVRTEKSVDKARDWQVTLALPTPLAAGRSYRLELQAAGSGPAAARFFIVGEANTRQEIGRYPLHEGEHGVVLDFRADFDAESLALDSRDFPVAGYRLGLTGLEVRETETGQMPEAKEQPQAGDALAELTARVARLENELAFVRSAAMSAVASNRFFRAGGRYAMNLAEPKTFNEKLLWLRINYWARNPINYYIADKYFFKYFTETLFGTEHSIPLLGVWDRARDIDFSQLPEEFVLKRTMGGGSAEVRLVNQATDDLDEVRRIAGRWMAPAPGRIPARIIAEPVIEADEDGMIRDYKFIVSAGRFDYAVVLEMPSGGGTRTNAYYSPQWARLDVRNYHPVIDHEIAKPECFDEMVVFAERVGRLFPHLRVDMYVQGDEFYVGELTAVSNLGMAPFNPVRFDRQWGQSIVLPTEEQMQEDFAFFRALFPELEERPVQLWSNILEYHLDVPEELEGRLPTPPEPFAQPVRS